MISFFKCCGFADIRAKMISIYVLNVTDIIFTLILCSTGLFMEANPLIAGFISNGAYSLFIKLAIPSALLLYLYFRIKKANTSQLRKANLFFNAILVLYVLINFSHIFWILVYLSAPSALGNMIA